MATSKVQKFVGHRDERRSNSHADGNASTRKQPVNAANARALQFQERSDGFLDWNDPMTGFAFHPNGNGHDRDVPSGSMLDTEYTGSNDSTSEGYLNDKNDQFPHRISNHPQIAQSNVRPTDDSPPNPLIQTVKSTRAQLFAGTAPTNPPQRSQIMRDADSYPATSSGRPSEQAAANFAGNQYEAFENIEDRRRQPVDNQQQSEVRQNGKKKKNLSDRRHSTDTEASFGHEHRRDLNEEHGNREAQQRQRPAPQQRSSMPPPGVNSPLGAVGANVTLDHGLQRHHHAIVSNVQDEQISRNAHPEQRERVQYERGVAHNGEKVPPTARPAGSQPLPSSNRQPHEVPPLRNDNGLAHGVPLDYRADVLSRKRFIDLHNEPFDKDPNPLPSTLPEDKQNATIDERLQYCFDLDETDQQNFFASLSLAEWEACGPWFMEQFRTANEQIVQRRQEKRKIAQEFEDDVAERHKAVEGEIAALSEALDDMKKNGGVLINSGTPKRKR